MCVARYSVVCSQCRLTTNMEATTAETVDLGPISCKVLIIGAGMAGLSAANHLLKNAEPDFLIAEARSRVGGRIVSTTVGK